MFQLADCCHLGLKFLQNLGIHSGRHNNLIIAIEVKGVPGIRRRFDGQAIAF